jgi:hypothetical protein
VKVPVNRTDQIEKKSFASIGAFSRFYSALRGRYKNHLRGLTNWLKTKSLNHRLLDLPAVSDRAAGPM